MTKRSENRSCEKLRTALRARHGAPYRGVSSNPPHLSPAFERGPDAALEPEAIDRRRRMDRADAAEADAGPLEPAFLQHVARRRIGDAGARVQFLVVEIAEGVVDQGAHGLGRKTFAPE